MWGTRVCGMRLGNGDTHVWDTCVSDTYVWVTRVWQGCSGRCMWDVLDVHVWDTCAWRGSAGGCVCWTWVCGGHVCVWDTHVHGRDVQDHTRVLNTCVCGRDMPGARVCVWNTCVHGRDMLGAYVCRDACARHGRVWSTCLCASAIPGARGFPGKPMFIPCGSSVSCFNPQRGTLPSRHSLKSHHNTRKTE